MTTMLISSINNDLLNFGDDLALYFVCKFGDIYGKSGFRIMYINFNIYI